MRYMVFPLIQEHGQWNIKDEVLSDVWNQMVSEQRAHKVFYNGYITTVYDFITFLKTGGVLPILIGNNETKTLCHIAWISDYGGGHACLHHCALGQFKRGAAIAGLEYYLNFKDSDTGLPLFETLIGITPENNVAAIRIARLMGFKLLSPAVPNLCNDVYTGERVGGIISYYEYKHGTPTASHERKGDTTWAAEAEEAVPFLV